MRTSFVPLSLFLAASHLLGAAVIATNYTGVTSGGFGLSTAGARAVQFTAGFTGNVTSIDLWLSAQGPGNTAYLDAYLMADNAGLPGAILEHIGNVQGNPSANFMLANALASGTTQVTAGVKYWIGGATAAGSNVAVVWGNGGTLLPEAGTSSGDVNGAWSLLGGNSTAAQFQVNGTPSTSVPEPSTFVLTGAAAVVLFVRRRARNRYFACLP